MFNIIIIISIVYAEHYFLDLGWRWSVRNLSFIITFINIVIIVVGDDNVIFVKTHTHITIPHTMSMM